jgi:hypothetical protein
MNNDLLQRSYSIKFSHVLSSVEYKRILQRIESLLPQIKDKKKEVSLNISVNKVNYVKEKFSLFGEENIKSFLKSNEEDVSSTSVAYDSRRQIEYLKFEDSGYHVRYEEVSLLPPHQFMKMRSMKTPKPWYYSLSKTVKYICDNMTTVFIESTKRASGSSARSCQFWKQKDEYSLSLIVHLSQPLQNTLLSTLTNSFYLQIWNLLFCSTKEYPVALENGETKKSIVEVYNQITQSRKEFVAFIGPSVVTFNFGNLKDGSVDIWNSTDKFSVTSKTDGLRYIGLFSSQKLFLLGKGGDVINFGIKIKEDLELTIVDGEWVCDYTKKRSHYLIFDLYFYKGKDVRNLDLYDRLELIRANDFQHVMIDENNIFVDVLIQVKKFLFPDENNMCSAIKNILEETKTMIYECDGIIFTRNVPLIGKNPWSLLYQEENESEVSPQSFYNTGKTWTSVVKWKPHTTLTVDFKIVFIHGGLVEFHSLLSSFDALDRNGVKNNYSSLGTNTSKTRISEKVRLTSNVCRNGDEIISGNIVEVLFVEEESTNGIFTVWEPQRVRSDKQVPNLESVAKENYILSRYPVTEQDLLTQRRYEVFGEGDPRKYDSVTLYKTENHEKSFIKPMTQLHMRLKRQFIEKMVHHEKKGMSGDSGGGGQKLRVLDLACGRFGEIQIWTKGTVEESIELFLGIDYSENEISDLHGGANIRLLEQSRRCYHSFDNFLFLQGDCSKPFWSNEFTSCSKYMPIYESFKDKSQSVLFPLFHNVFTKKFHLCTMQFALHYFCSPDENYRTLHTLAENISSSLVDGGKFFGTCIDGRLMRKELDSQGNLVIQSPEGKTVLSVRRDSENPSGVFVFIESIGQEIFEFYVDFEVVDAIFEKYSLFVSESDVGDKEVRTHHLGKTHVEDILTEDTKKLPEIQPFLRFSCLHTMFVYEKRR